MSGTTLLPSDQITLTRAGVPITLTAAALATALVPMIGTVAGEPGAAGTPGAAGSPGATGQPGTSIYSGFAPPSAGLGNNGDLYIYTDYTGETTLLGPKTDGVWPNVGVLLGGELGASPSGQIQNTATIAATAIPIGTNAAQLGPSTVALGSSLTVPLSSTLRIL